MRRFTSAGLIFLGALCCQPMAAQADNYPSKRIVLIVPFSPGSGADLFARALVPGMRDALKFPIVIENREGAAGLIGLMDASHAPKDGYTFAMSAEPPFSLAPKFQTHTTYDPVKTFAPIARVGAVPMILVVSPQSGIKTVSDLRQYVQSHPGHAYYASNGNASPAQVSMELFKAASGISLPEVTYKSTNQMTTDVAGGQVLATFLSVSSGEGLIQAGKLRALAVGSTHRLAKFPNVPTLAEALNKPGYHADVAYEFFVPAGTPRDRIQRLFEAMAKSFKTSQTQASMKQLSLVPDLKNPEEFAKILQEDAARAQQVYDAVQKSREKK